MLNAQYEAQPIAADGVARPVCHCPLVTFVSPAKTAEFPQKKKKWVHIDLTKAYSALGICIAYASRGKIDEHEESVERFEGL